MDGCQPVEPPGVGRRGPRSSGVARDALRLAVEDDLTLGYPPGTGGRPERLTTDISEVLCGDLPLELLELVSFDGFAELAGEPRGDQADGAGQGTAHRGAATGDEQTTADARDEVGADGLDGAGVLGVHDESPSPAAFQASG